MNYTVNWTDIHTDNWKQYLNKFKDMPGIYGIEIGVYQGRSSVWFLNNILTHPNSRLYCIDCFRVMSKEIFENNIKEQANPEKVILFAEDSTFALKKFNDPEYFHFAYIDGDHTPYGTLKDAVLVWDLLKHGGIMIFDDYNLNDKYSCPKPGIDAFLNVIKGSYELLCFGDQVIIKKK